MPPSYSGERGYDEPIDIAATGVIGTLDDQRMVGPGAIRQTLGQWSASAPGAKDLRAHDSHTNKQHLWIDGPGLHVIRGNIRSNSDGFRRCGHGLHRCRCKLAWLQRDKLRQPRLSKF